MADFPSVTLFSRVASYPAVQQFYNSAKGYYSSAKESNTLVKYGLETAETKLNEFAEASKPVLKKLEEPQYQRYIQNADSFGCRQLDFIETRVSNAKQALDSLSAKKEELLNSPPVASVKNAIETHVLQPAAPAFHETAKLVNGLVNNTVNNCLASTENFVDRVLPEQTEQSARDEKEVHKEESPLYLRVFYLGSKVSHRVGAQVLHKLQNLKPRSYEDAKNYAYVNLIEYSKYLDSNLSEKVSPVTKQATEYAKSIGSRLETFVNTLEKNPVASPYVKYLKQVYPYDGHFHFYLPQVSLKDVKAYVGEVRNQVLASPLSAYVLENLKTGAAYVQIYTKSLEENPTVAHSLDLAKSFALDWKDKVLGYVQLFEKKASVTIEEVQEEASEAKSAVVETVTKAQKQVEKKAEELQNKQPEVVQQNGVVPNGVQQNGHEEVEEEEEEEELVEETEGKLEEDNPTSPESN